MTDKEILQKAIEKAEKNGFDYRHAFEMRPEDEAIWYLNSYHVLIFNHDFAKAFWGNQEHCYLDCSTVDNCQYCSAYIEEYEYTVGIYCWQQHLSDMVLTKEPLKYLEKFLGE